MPSVRTLRRAGAALATATTLIAGGAVVTAAPASAEVQFFGLVPKIQSNIDVAAVHGLVPDFGLNKRDNSGLDSFERWDEQAGVDANGINVVYLVSKAPGPNGIAFCMDSQAPNQNKPEKFDPVGTRPCDNSSSQRWLKGAAPGGVSYKNAYSRFHLTLSPTSNFPAYEQRSFDQNRSVFSHKD
ncbi:hypothetical protein [Streptomyces sp. NPDC099088]|uniref:hypothetical protein n=1 Tax=Streptomyces sp. NPDC099088 TaxID=3366101 RepID=UPI0038124A7C